MISLMVTLCAMKSIKFIDGLYIETTILPITCFQIIMAGFTGQNAMMQLLEKIENFFTNETLPNEMPTLQDLKNPTSSMVFKFLGRALFEFNIDLDSLRIVRLAGSDTSS